MESTEMQKRVDSLTGSRLIIDLFTVAERLEWWTAQFRDTADKLTQAASSDDFENLLRAALAPWEAEVSFLWDLWKADCASGESVLNRLRLGKIIAELETQKPQ